MIDKDMAAGLLLLEQCESPRTWTPGESMLLKAIATQVVIAINNTKLRRLVRSLAGTDPETGLLPRSAYLECVCFPKHGAPRINHNRFRSAL